MTADPPRGSWPTQFEDLDHLIERDGAQLETRVEETVDVLGRQLPVYSIALGAAMEPEAQALCAVVTRELLTRPFAVARASHSGFGVRDRIWFPFACSGEAIEQLPEIRALTQLFADTYAHHRYLFEPQCRQYCAHGDLWDHLYLQAGEHPGRAFLPLRLEMGSWLRVRKNPRQLFSRLGTFNPLIEHRQQRVLHRHIRWMEFLARATCSYVLWLPRGEARAAHRQLALQRWYGAARG